LVPLLVAPFLFAGSARAQVLEQTFQLHAPANVTPFQAVLDVPRFDPALGTHVEVRLELFPHVSGVLRVENTDATSPHAVTLTFMSAVALRSASECLLVGQSNGYVS